MTIFGSVYRPTLFTGKTKQEHHSFISWLLNPPGLNPMFPACKNLFTSKKNKPLSRLDGVLDDNSLRLKIVLKISYMPS